MKKTILSIATAVVLAVALAGCSTENDGKSYIPAQTTTVSMERFSAAVPADLTLEGAVGTSTTYVDGGVTSRSTAAKNYEETVRYVVSEVGDRGFDAVEQWARGLPGSATDQPSGKAFGLGPSVEGAVWDDPVFYDAAGGDGIAVSYVLGDVRTTYHFVDLGDGYYAEVQGTFPEAAYAKNPAYYDYAFQTIVTNE